MDLQYNSFSYLKAYIILFSSIVTQYVYYLKLLCHWLELYQKKNT